jgi:hypothetical protein
MSIRNVRKWRLASLISVCLLSACFLSTLCANAQAPDSCRSIFIKVSLNVYEDFQLELGGGLLFRVMSEKDPGWFIDVVPAEANTKDYVYPVNLPLRLNPNQTLGPGYGETVKSSLSHPHEMNFLLDHADYDRIFGLVDNVLRSYQTSDPDRALSDYTNAVDDARKGWLRVRISSYKTDPKSGALSRLKLKVQIVTPSDFQFAPGVSPWPAACHR